jgi:hypothetical protein
MDAMKIGDLVKVKDDWLDRARSRTEVVAQWPHLAEVGIVVGWESYHPIIHYSSGRKIMAKQRLEVLR